MFQVVGRLKSNIQFNIFGLIQFDIVSIDVYITYYKHTYINILVYYNIQKKKYCDTNNSIICIHTILHIIIIVYKIYK